MLRIVLVIVCLGATALAAPVPAGSVAFPVRYSTDQRFLVDQNGVPFPIMGRTAWFVTSLAVADYHTFVDDTASRGYDAIELHVINHDPRGNHPPFNGNGDAPFLNRLDGTSWNGSLSGVAPDFTTPKESYWSFVDGLLSYCESKNILVFLFPAYVGYLGGDQGWMQEMVANGPKKMQSYGAWIATRYKNQKNLVWMMGGDMGTPPNVFNAEQTAVESALLTGLQSVKGQQSVFFSAEWNTESIATDQVDFGTAMTLNGAYSFVGYVNEQGRRGYSHTPVEPAFLLEEPYDQEGPDGNGVNPNATQPVRRFQWWGWLSSTGGYISGNGYVWPFRAPAWHDHLDTQGSRDMARLNAFMVSNAWYKLVPSNLSGMRNLITAGGSTVLLDDYVAASATFDGTLLVAYIPPAHTGSITVDMAAMSAPARARWFDPTNAAYTNIGIGLPNTGTRVFNPPGNNSTGEADWALIIDVPMVAPTPTITPSVTATATATPTSTATTSASVPPTPTITPSVTATVTATPTSTATASASVPPTPTITPSVTATATATSTPTATAIGTVPPTPSASPTPTSTPIPTPTPTSVAQPINLSTRLRVQTDDNVGIGGFIITGGNPKHLLIRAIGPSLTQFGIPDALADPVLELHGPIPFVTVTDDNWRDDPLQEIAIIATGIPPANNLEAAIDATLDPGAYTAVVKGKNNSSGVGLIEVYDLSQAALAKLSNISTRAFAGTENNVVIAGFILGHSNGDDRIVVRGIGPSLAAAGVPNVLENPTLELHDVNGALLLANNDWMDDPVQAAELSAAGLAPTNNLESGLSATLSPGLYTALLEGLNNSTGVGLIEVYDRGATP